MMQTKALSASTGFALGCSLLLMACVNSPVTPGEAVARVGERVLTSEQVVRHIPGGLSVSDSATAMQRYVDQWVREQILVAQAEKALPLEEKAFEDEIDAYRNALLLHAFKERFVNERMDTEVDEEEAMAFYEANQESFTLADYAVRVLFINAPETADLDAVQEPFAALDSTGMLDIERWCVENGAIYGLDGATWWSLSAFTKEVPMGFYRTEAQLSSRKLVDFEADSRHYLVRFLEHALKDEVAPFSAVRDDVVEMILHRRKQQLLLAMEEQLVVKAWAEGLVEVREGGGTP
jgi:hypothetical protein